VIDGAQLAGGAQEPATDPERALDVVQLCERGRAAWRLEDGALWRERDRGL